MPVVFGVEQERLKDGQMRRVPQSGQISLAELEGCWELLQELPHAVQVEKKQRRGLDVLVQNVPQSGGERVPQNDPLFLNQGLKSGYRPPVRVEQNLR